MKGLSRAHEEHIRDLLNKASVARDCLPYTEEFTKLKEEYFDRTFRKITDSEFWNACVTVAKKGGITGKDRVKITPSLNEDQIQILLRLLPVAIGERDRLPYTDRFSNMVKKFNTLSGLNLTEREVWLVILSQAK